MIRSSVRLLVCLGLMVWVSLLESTASHAQDFDSLVPGAAASGAPRQAPTPRPQTAPAPSPTPVDPSAARRRTAAPTPPPAATIQRPVVGGSAPVTITASVDRAAAWIGEPILYEVDVVCPPGTDILAADLSRDRLRPTGLEVVDAVQTRTVENDGTIRYGNRFRLVSYQLDAGPVGIEPQPVRYYVHTAGQSADTLVPADEIALAPVSLAIRSSLPDANVMWLRDTRPIVAMPALLTYLAPAGVAIGALAVLPLAFLVVGVVNRRRPKREVRPRGNVADYRARLEQARSENTGDVSARVRAFEAASEVLRARLTDLDVPAQGLTADELESALAAKAPKLAGSGLASMLHTCERALYGGPEHMPAASEVGPALDAAEQLLTARAR